MSSTRKFSLIVLVSALGLGVAHGAAFADESIQQASFVVRATGKTGSVRATENYQRREKPLGREVDGGEIPRAALEAELNGGIPKFLRQVRTEAIVSNGRWKGWRIVSLFPQRNEIHVRVLRPGDTVLRVNGQSIERPEAFMNVWESLRKADELVLEIERNGEPSTLRYRITG